MFLQMPLVMKGYPDPSFYIRRIDLPLLYLNTNIATKSLVLKIGI